MAQLPKVAKRFTHPEPTPDAPRRSSRNGWEEIGYPGADRGGGGIWPEWLDAEFDPTPALPASGEGVAEFDPSPALPASGEGVAEFDPTPALPASGEGVAEFRQLCVKSS
ncbi:MAG: hypothetical protein ACLQVD_07840 [Capsulimonadaceae bacterium]